MSEKTRIRVWVQATDLERGTMVEGTAFLDTMAHPSTPADLDAIAKALIDRIRSALPLAQTPPP